MAKLPDNPNTRLERYLARLAGQDVSIPDTPINRIECYLAYLIENGGGAAAPGAGGHNSVFRGKNLGSSFTAAQADAIDSGTFDDMFLGDYWEKAGRKYRVAAFDYFLNSGTNPYLKHHVVVVPDTSLYSHVMNDTDTVNGGFINSLLYTQGLTQANEMVASVFGPPLQVPVLLSSARTGANASSWAWANVGACIMSEGMVYSVPMWGAQVHSPYNNGNRVAQLPLFMLRPDLINVRNNYWFSDIASETGFASHLAAGRPGLSAASSVLGVRPFICIGKAS